MKEGISQYFHDIAKLSIFQYIRIVKILKRANGHAVCIGSLRGIKDVIQQVRHATHE